MANIGAEVQIYKTLRERLILAYNLDEDDGQLIDDTLNGELPLADIILQMVRDAKRSEAYAHALTAIINDNLARRKRLEEKAEKLRGLAMWAMSEVGLTKLQEADMTISSHMGKSALVIDGIAGTVPDSRQWVVTEPVTYRWDKEALRKAVEAGNEVALTIAHMSNPKPILTVRTK